MPTFQPPPLSLPGSWPGHTAADIGVHLPTHPADGLTDVVQLARNVSVKSGVRVRVEVRGRGFLISPSPSVRKSDIVHATVVVGRDHDGGSVTHTMVGFVEGGERLIACSCGWKP